MSLKEYQKKRKFGKTPEPRGRAGKDKKSHRFVIQEHDARNLHYDLRLEMDGVLKSWAVPKEPPQSPGIKRLAIRTEDHPVEYLDFEGKIPKGEYGAGTVKIWDKGEFKLDADSAKKPEDGNLIFILSGKKIKGKYVLINTKNNNWLFFQTKGD